MNKYIHPLKEWFGSLSAGKKAGFITAVAAAAALITAACFLPPTAFEKAVPAASVGEEPPVVSAADSVPSCSDVVSDSSVSFTDAAAPVTTTAVTTTTTAATTKATVSDGKHVNHEDVKNADYKSDYYIIVYTKNNTVRVLGKDEYGGYTKPVYNFLCSTAKSPKITPEGLYAINKRYDWRAMFGDVYAQYAVRFYGNYLFHSVPYLEESPDTLEMEEYEKLGTPASLGCVRLCVRDAKWIYDNCRNGTQVRVIAGKDGPSHGSTRSIPTLNYDELYRGWDPTDGNPANPYNKASSTTSETTTTTTTTIITMSTAETSVSSTTAAATATQTEASLTESTEASAPEETTTAASTSSDGPEN